MKDGPAVPRWVKAIGVVAFVFVIVVAALLLAGHRPGSHLGSPVTSRGRSGPVASRSVP